MLMALRFEPSRFFLKEKSVEKHSTFLHVQKTLLKMWIICLVFFEMRAPRIEYLFMVYDTVVNFTSRKLSDNKPCGLLHDR